jgi:spore coat polysaccharide biosynthesis protein SpsF (cytidylyltransferase family)
VGSSRLPFKVVLPFDHTNSIIEIILRELKAKGGGVPLVLATTVSSDDDVLCRVAENEGVECFRGPEQDVLGRFIQAAEKHGFDRIVRICADNPYLDVQGTMSLVEQMNDDLDYVAYRVTGDIPSIKSHLGLWGEIVSLKALKKVKQETSSKIYYEHVTNYVYGHPDKFNIKWIDAPPIVYSRDDIRLTIDDVEDFNMGKELLYEMKQAGTGITTENIVDFLDSNTHYLELMKNQIKKYTK